MYILYVYVYIYIYIIIIIIAPILKVLQKFGDETCITLRRIESSKTHSSSLLLLLLMFWWTLGAIKVPGPRSRSTLSPRAVHFMELGCWAFPVALWCSVGRLAINSSLGENRLAQWLRLEQEQWRSRGQRFNAEGLGVA